MTNQAVIAQSGVSDASSFFNELLTRPYVQQFLVGPHVYCADVSGSAYATSGQALYSKLDTTFGYLNLQGTTLQFCRHSTHLTRALRAYNTQDTVTSETTLHAKPGGMPRLWQ